MDPCSVLPLRDVVFLACQRFSELSELRLQISSVALTYRGIYGQSTFFGALGVEVPNQCDETSQLKSRPE